MKRDFINYCGLLGIVAFLSYTAAVVFSPLAYPGYNWMAQAVSDLSAANAPSLRLWNQLSSLYNMSTLVCAMMVCELYPLSRTFLNLSTHIFRHDFFSVSCLIDRLYFQYL